MRKKIVITGGLGYIGTELCKLYSGVSWHHKITVIDNRFISERVNQIRNWNMEFIQGDILDKDIIQKHFKDADVVHHLAGVTAVPKTKSESSEAIDKKIKEVGEIGTQNILDVISDNCKIIFPSTHVVYEGINEVKKDWEALDRKKIFNAQTNLIKEFNSHIPQAFGNFIPNYKNIASVGQYFHSSGLKPKTRLLIEDRIKGLVISHPRAIKEDKMKPLDNLTYNTFVSKFNDTYKETLLKEQRELLTNFITSFSDNGLGLKMFMNEELGRLKEECDQLSEGKWADKIRLVKQRIEEFKNKPLTEEVVKDVFHIQQLLSEIK